MTRGAVRRIDPVFVHRVWGRTDLSPLYGTQDQVIGEVWFPIAPDFPILVKFLFTSARLSVQVHPNDDFAALHENSRGKTEMWHILAAEPGSEIALGLKSQMEKETLRAALEDGSVVDLLNWVPVSAGETFFAPAGTIHAIGGGIVLCEIQQNSDVTYRLHDYGRPRELHLEKGLEVADMGVCAGRHEFPVCCSHFTTEVLEFPVVNASDIAWEHLLIATAGTGTIAGEPFRSGECWYADPSGGPVEIAGEPGARILRAYCGHAQQN
ncbi:MAG: class I mannose-6-phosphate isomerase [Bryobacteraceae bacterium]|nr:class I mannose-6-phosphate isomerase [Bryobacteraceae bacterium]